MVERKVLCMDPSCVGAVGSHTRGDPTVKTIYMPFCMHKLVFLEEKCILGTRC